MLSSEQPGPGGHGPRHFLIPSFELTAEAAAGRKPRRLCAGRARTHGPAPIDWAALRAGLVFLFSFVPPRDITYLFIPSAKKNHIYSFLQNRYSAFKKNKWNDDILME